jgi:gas vesicle protein
MNDQSKFIAGLLLGAAAGAALGYFLTTDKGKEIVDEIKSAAANAGEDVKEKVKQFESEIGSAVEKGKKWANDFGKETDASATT